MNKAVFLDRDGVINELVINLSTGEFEPPHSPDDLVLISNVIPALRSLQDAGFDLVLISNQPDYAKGKTTLEQLQTVHEKLDFFFKTNKIRFLDYYYCYHHPQGIIPEYSFLCECRKPKPYYLMKAARDYGLDLANSWMVGDRDTDIECGKAAGTQTILILEPHSARYQGSSSPDYQVGNINEAVQIIIQISSGNNDDRTPYGQSKKTKKSELSSS